jgi:aspartate kinase
MIRVYKFGGASVKDSAAIMNAYEILQKSITSGSILLVVSAMGKMTNAFEQLHKAWFSGEDTSVQLEHIKEYHYAIVDRLFGNASLARDEITTIFDFIETTLSKNVSQDDSFDMTYDNLIPYGEYLSSCILTHYVNFMGMDARLADACHYLHADNLWREGRIQWDKTCTIIQEDLKEELENINTRIVITQGFVARSSQGQMVTLGREGSDFSASVFAFALDAQSVTIWKDVEGLYNADPKVFADVKLIPHLSYHEAVELAYYGQSIIHPKTIKPLQNKHIPLFIKSFVNPALPGSVIDKDTSFDSDVPCFILKKDQMLISVSPKDFAFINEHNMSEIISHLAELRIRMNVMQNSAISFSFCADFSNFKLHQFIDAHQEKYFVKYNTQLELATIRNYNEEIIENLTGNKKVYLEQRSRATVQLVTGPK